MEKIMEATSVTSKGQVTIPKSLRQEFGIRQGSKVGFSIVGDHVELRLISNPAKVPKSGFGLLKAKKVAIPADFDPATLLIRRKAV